MGFEGDDMLDMQTRIGSFSGLQRRLNTVKTENIAQANASLGKHRSMRETDDLYGELMSDQGAYITHSHSTQESLSGLDLQPLFSEEDLHQSLFDSYGSHKKPLMLETVGSPRIAK